MKWVLMILMAAGFIYCQEPEHKNRASKISETSSEIVAIVLKVEGMTCGSCEFHVDRAVKKVQGVSFCEADSDKGEAVIKYDPKKADIKEIIASITSLGYTANVR